MGERWFGYSDGLICISLQRADAKPLPNRRRSFCCHGFLTHSSRAEGARCGSKRGERGVAGREEGLQPRDSGSLEGTILSEYP